MKTQTQSVNSGAAWDALGWQRKEQFLARHNFKLGWSSHTWRYLDRPIQAAFEAFNADRLAALDPVNVAAAVLSAKGGAL